MTKSMKISIPPRSPIGSDDEVETTITLLEETGIPLKETIIEHKKIDFNPISINKQQEEPEETQEEAEAEEEELEEEAIEEEALEEEAQEEEEELDNNTKDFIVLCTHRYLYKQEIPSLSSNKRRQKSMEKIVARHVDSICEAFRYLS